MVTSIIPTLIVCSCYLAEAEWLVQTCFGRAGLQSQFLRVPSLCSLSPLASNQVLSVLLPETAKMGKGPGEWGGVWEGEKLSPRPGSFSKCGFPLVGGRTHQHLSQGCCGDAVEFLVGLMRCSSAEAVSQLASQRSPCGVWTLQTLSCNEKWCQMWLNHYGALTEHQACSSGVVCRACTFRASSQL